MLPGAESPVHRSPVSPGRVRRGRIWLEPDRLMRPAGRAADGALLNTRTQGHALFRLTAQLGVVAGLLCLAAANIYVRATWSEPEDGVLWTATPEGVVVAQEVAADSPAARVQLRPGDVLEAIDGVPVEAPADVTAAMHRALNGEALKYTILRTKTPEMLTVTLAVVLVRPDLSVHVPVAV